MNSKKTEEEYWLALLRAPGVGPVKFARLIERFGSPRGVFEAEWSEWQAFSVKKKELLDYLQNPDWHAIEKDMQWLAQPDNYLLTLDHPDYPPLLREIDDPPPLLFVHGDYTLLSSHQLAMVGTRHPTQEGEQTAREFAEHLTSQGFTITSGMAYGIDGASHWGALAGTGKTIAVAGTGLDRVYPAEHRDLAHKIAQTGALISELPLGTQVRRRHFPIRSRVVSGLSLGTLVVEAPEESGALYTARHAIKQGRELFAIPGSIHNPLVKGCHLLIKKEGAKLVEKATDILEELRIHRPLTAAQAKKDTPSPSPNSPPISQHEVPTNSTTAASPFVLRDKTTDSQKNGVNALAGKSPSHGKTPENQKNGINALAGKSPSRFEPNENQKNGSDVLAGKLPSHGKTPENQKNGINALAGKSPSRFELNENQKNGSDDLARKSRPKGETNEKNPEKNILTSESDLDSDYVRLLGYLEVGPRSIDNLVEQSGLTAGDVSSMLLILELQLLVVTQPGGLYARK